MKHVTGTKVRGPEPSEPFDTEAPDTAHATIGFGIYSAGFWSYFGSIFPHYTPISSLWDEM